MEFWPTFETTETPDRFVGFMIIHVHVCLLDLVSGIKLFL